MGGDARRRAGASAKPEARESIATFDAIVIGGGVAGLSAAGELVRNGRRVCLLEATRQLGGRIATVRLPGWPMPIELGAEFVHARPDYFTRALAGAAIDVGAQEGPHVLAQHGRLDRSGKLWRSAFRWVERIPDLDESYATSMRRLTRGKAVDPRVLAVAKSYVEGFNAAESGRISSRALFRQSQADEGYDGGRIDRVLGGYDRLVDWLARPLSTAGTLALHTRALTIDWRRPEVLVRCRQGYGGAPANFRARAAIVAVPISLLKAGQPERLRFSPPLPDGTRDAVLRIAMGSVSKLVLRWRHPPWKDGRALGLAPATMAMLDGLSFLHTPGGPIPTWWVPRPLDFPVLIGWAAGPAATSFARQHRGDKLRAIRAGAAGLGAALGVDAHRVLAEVEDAEFIDWSTMPFCHGAYSWLPVGAVDAPAVLARPVEGRLFFAGEATHKHDQLGTVHGAMETGLRAAKQVLDVLSGRSK